MSDGIYVRVTELEQRLGIVPDPNIVIIKNPGLAGCIMACHREVTGHRNTCKAGSVWQRVFNNTDYSRLKEEE
jgi:hypothetical protein